MLHNCSPRPLHLCCAVEVSLLAIPLINHINRSVIFNDILESHTTNLIQSLIATSSLDDRLEHSPDSSRDSEPAVAGRSFGVQSH